MTPYICDFDDYCTEHNILDKLKELKQILPNFKVTLFTIPAKTSEGLLKETSKYDWIQMAVHGFTHEGNYEFATLDYLKATYLISGGYKPDYYVKGFKAPGWQISLGTMEALKDLGFWIATQWSDDRLEGDKNGPYQPAVIDELFYYAFREYPAAIHGHAWECCGNGLNSLWQKLINLPKDSEFKFIDDYIYEEN